VSQLAGNDCLLLKVSCTIQAGALGPLVQQALDVTSLQQQQHTNASHSTAQHSTKMLVSTSKTLPQALCPTLENRLLVVLVKDTQSRVSRCTSRLPSLLSTHTCTRCALNRTNQPTWNANCSSGNMAHM
jgi:hypothetical protein